LLNVASNFLPTWQSTEVAAAHFTAHCPLPTAHFLLAASFMTPGFAVAGILLASIPLIIHFLNRRRFKTINWAAMEFLLRAMKKNQRRLKFEQWLLLAVRCLVLAFLGFALARPLGCNEGSLAALAGHRSALHVFIIDNSYSMAYQADRPGARTHLDQAKKMAAELIDRFSTGGESVAIIVASNPATAVISTPTYDLNAAKSAIEHISQSYRATDLPGAIQKALDLAQAEAKQPTKNLYLFTDGTRSSISGPSADSLKRVCPELSRTYHTTLFNLGRPSQSNSTVTMVRPTSSVVAARMNIDIAATVRGYGSTDEASLRWLLDDQPLPSSATLHPAADTPDTILPQLALKTGGAHVITASLGANDRLPIDDARSRVIDVANELKVLLVEGERGVGPLGSSGAFIRVALAPPSATTPSYVAPDVISDLELPNKLLSDYRAVILTNVAQLTTNEADLLASYVKAGGALLIFPGEAVSADAWNSVLLPRQLIPGPLVKRITAGDDGRGFTFDFKPLGNMHPFLEIFRGEEKSGLDTARTFTYFQVDLQNKSAERVLDFLSTGQGAKDPAITVHTLGKGRVVFVATSSGADGWTALPARQVFAPLLHELLNHAVTPADEWLNLSVGQSLEIPVTMKLSAPPTLEDATHQVVAMDPVTLPDGHVTYRSPALEKPGIYHLSAGNVFPVAVSVPPEEADVRTLDNAAVKKAIGDAEMEFETDKLPVAPEFASAGNDFGWMMMLAVLLLAATETILALRAGHYRRSVA
jgi:Mg-chelatase subunit ChlD